MAVSNQGAQSLQTFAQSFGNSYAGGMQQANQAKVQAGKDKERDFQMQQIMDQNAKAAKKAFKADWNEALLEGDVYGDWNYTQQFMASHPEEFGGQVLRGTTRSDFLKSGETDVTPATRAMYKDDTGYDLPADTNQAIAQLQSGAMLQKADGSTRFVASNSLAAGLSNYSAYKDKYMRDRGDAGLSKPQAAANHKTKIDTIGFENASDQQQNEYVAFAKDGGVLKTYMRQDLMKPNILTSTSYATKDNWNPEMITDKDLASAFKMQSGAEYEYKGRNDRLGEIATVANFSRVGKMIDNMDDTAQGELNSVLTTWAARANEEDWKNMDQGKRQAVLNKLALQTTGNLAVMELVKLMSGAAVTEDEFGRYQDAIFGGGLKIMNAQAIRASFGAATDSLYEKARTQIENIGHRTPYDKLDLAQKLENNYSSIEPKEEPANKPGETPATLGQTADKTMVSIGKQTVKEVAALTGGIVDSVFKSDEDNTTPNVKEQPEDEWSFKNMYNNATSSLLNTVNDWRGVEPQAVKATTTSVGGNSSDVQTGINSGEITPTNVNTTAGKTVIQRNAATRKSTELSKKVTKWESMQQKELEAYVENGKAKTELSPLEYTNLISVIARMGSK